MRNIEVLSPEETRARITSLWKTPQFKQSQAAEGYIHELVSRFDTTPLAFFEMSEPEVEWSHFTTWMGAISMREYENPVIHDLYLLHELWHAATMTYDSEAQFSQWFRKMTVNETFSSLHSEAFVYHLMPGLRKQSFPFEIWVDRFIQNGRVTAPPTGLDDLAPVKEALRLVPNAAASMHGQGAFFRALLAERIRTMRAPLPFDLTEMQIHYYAMQNVQWANIWSKRWREVETHMEDLTALSKSGALEEAIQKHRNFFETRCVEEGMPFPDEARAFAAIVQQNKKRQGNGLFQS